MTLSRFAIAPTTTGSPQATQIIQLHPTPHPVVQVELDYNPQARHRTLPVADVYELVTQYRQHRQ